MNLLADYSGTIGLLFFFAVFVGIGIWALRPSNKHIIESHKYIPLTEDNNDLTQ